MSDDEIMKLLEEQRDLMISVASGGPQINTVNEEYKQRRKRIAEELSYRELEDPNPHVDLWAWYGRWTAGDMPRWRDRRVYVNDMYTPLIEQIRSRSRGIGEHVSEEPTGWVRVDRTAEGVRRQLDQATNEEQYQTIGLLCREVLISVAQTVFNPSLHPIEDGTVVSPTDAKRMLDAYIMVELAGRANEVVRRYAKTTLDLANELQHHRTANYRHASLCAEATFSVVNLVAIISGRRDRLD